MDLSILKALSLGLIIKTRKEPRVIQIANDTLKNLIGLESVSRTDFTKICFHKSVFATKLCFCNKYASIAGVITSYSIHYTKLYDPQRKQPITGMAGFSSQTPERKQAIIKHTKIHASTRGNVCYRSCCV